MTAPTRFFAVRFALLLVLVLGASAPAFAQPASQVKVVRDRATIWRRDARIPATTVRHGTVLDAVARQGDWYIVFIPNSPEPNELGLVSASVVELVPGSPVPPDRAPATPRASTSGMQATATESDRAVQVFGFGQVGVGRWTAHNTFDAVTGSEFFPMFGGGGEVRFRNGLFGAGSVEYFQKTGQRVFVDNGRAFRLGIADQIRVIPIEGRLGYRRPLEHLAWYVAGGAGVYMYRERSDFSNGSDSVDDTFTSYHALGGVEVGRGIVRTAFEVEFTTVPNALGSAGASAAFGEHNLGGIQARVRILAGK
jgi:hypothetical protein